MGQRLLPPEQSQCLQGRDWSASVLNNTRWGWSSEGGRREAGGAALNSRNYRVILKNSRHAIHEVFYDEQGDIWACTEEPAYPEGETLEELREDLEHRQLALARPVLKYADLVPDYERPGFDVEQPF